MDSNEESAAFELISFVRNLAEEKICDDEPEKCTLQSGPYCGHHPFDEDIRIEARRIIERLGKL